MIKDDLVKEIAVKFDLSLNLTAKIVQALLDEIINGLVSGSRIELRRFGVFRLKQQKPRVIILPSGQKITRPAQKVITFNPSPNVKKKLNPPTKKQLKAKFIPGHAPRIEFKNETKAEKRPKEKKRCCAWTGNQTGHTQFHFQNRCA